MKGTATLYICHDGVLPPLGQSQVVQYLRELAKDGKLDITLVSFEKTADLSNEKLHTFLKRTLSEAGVRWIPLRYHRRPTGLATLYDITLGFLVCAYIAWTRNVRIVHTRSYIPAAMGLLIKWFFGASLIFDMRGFWADERFDLGSFTHSSFFYRLGKWVEERLLTRADVVVSLTHAGVREMQTWPYLKRSPARFEVISTCANLHTFCLKPRPPETSPRSITIGYVGSTLGWYLFEPVVECFKLVREIHPDAKMLILNRDDHAFLREQFTQRGVPETAIEIKSVDHAKVADEMARMDATFFFIKPVYSKLASAPTKLGEFLGCGIPCLTNTGIGDMSEILKSEGVGISASDWNEDTLRQAVPALLSLAKEAGIRERCARAAWRHFSLEDGAASYRRIYDSLL